MKHPEAPGSSPGGESISRNSVFAFATQLSTAVFTAVLTVYLVRALGPAGFGTLALALSISALAQRPSDLGTTQSAARFVAERHGDAAGLAGLLGMALRLRVITAATIGTALFVLAEPISNLYDTPELFWPLRAVAIAFVGQSVMRFIVVMCVALRRAPIGFWLVSSESATEFTATVALVMLGGGAAGAAFGRAVGYLFGALLGIYLLGRILGRSPLFGAGPSPVSRREFVGYAGAMFIVAGAFSAFAAIDVLLIGAFLGTTAVGTFSAPARLITFLGFPGLALAQGVAPRLARHLKEKPNVHALGLSLRYILILQMALVTLVMVWAGPIVQLTLGSEFSESEGVLRALAPLVFLTGLAPLLVAPLNYMGEARRRIPIAIGVVILNAAIDVILIPEIGILGAAIGTNVSYVTFIGAHVWLSHRLIGLPLERLAQTLARSLLAAGPMAAVLALVGTGGLSVFDWIVGLVGGAAVYLAVLIATRELSIAEIRTVSASVRGAVRNR